MKLQEEPELPHKHRLAAENDDRHLADAFAARPDLGGSFFSPRVAIPYVPPFTLVFLRLSIAALALHLHLRGNLDIDRHLAANWRSFLLLGLINNALPHTLIFLGQPHIGAGTK